MIRRLMLISFLLLVGALSANAQFDIPEINKLKEIKMLESNVFDVQRLLFDYESEGWDSTDHEQHFDTEKYSINIYYSSGDCSEEEELWLAPEAKVIRIEIEPDDTLKAKDLGFDFAKLRREQKYVDVEDRFIYSDKERGVAFDIDEDEVNKIILLPFKSSKTEHCKSKTAKQFFEFESWFGTKPLKDRHPPGDLDFPPNVTELILSESEIPLVRYNKQIKVSTTALDPENDVLTYHYTVSGGKIVGSGFNVIWDLSGVLMGTYTLTAGVDDGCGICGKTMTKSVTIR